MPFLKRGSSRSENWIERVLFIVVFSFCDSSAAGTCNGVEKQGFGESSTVRNIRSSSRFTVLASTDDEFPALSSGNKPASKDVHAQGEAGLVTANDVRAGTAVMVEKQTAKALRPIRVDGMDVLAVKQA